MSRRSAPTHPQASARHVTALAVLDTTHAVLSRGWLQCAERLVLDADGQLVVNGQGEVVRACLIGAVVEAARRYGGRSFLASGPALDALWAAYADWGRDIGALGSVPAPMIRASRCCELARWNDAPGRQRAEVLALVERATQRVRAELAALSAPTDAAVSV